MASLILSIIPARERCAQAGGYPGLTPWGRGRQSVARANSTRDWGSPFCLGEA
jgi:hypothetical protein